MEPMLKLKVQSRKKGLASSKSSFIVEYEGKEYRVPMFGFQEQEDTPETIDCHIDGNNMVQNVRTLYDRFYPNLNKPYLFKVKNKWTKYYEVIDPRMEKENKKERLLFINSSPDLEKGQEIMCRITEIDDSQLTLQLENANPSFIKFHLLENIFNTDNDNMNKWLCGLFEKNFMSDIKKMYDDEDGRWILHFANIIENLIYDILTDKNDSRDILTNFCSDWLNMMEHSTFIVDMSKEERKNCGKDLEKSIEICEDYLDAVNMPNKSVKVREYIASLDPRYYLFRIERRFRFLACAFCLDFHLLEENIQSLLERLKDMGEEMCCDERITPSLTYILKFYAEHISAKVETCLSFDGTVSQSIKNCVLSLCYLTKIMYKRNDRDLAHYTSCLYQLLSLLDIYSKEEKLKLLRISYDSLFINTYPLSGHKWETFESILYKESYRFSKERVPHVTTEQFQYSDGNTEVKITNGSLTIAPINTNKNELASLLLHSGLSANLCYNKSLSRLSQQNDFGEIQNAWNLVERSTFAPAKVIQKKEQTLVDGDDIDIYITEIINPSKARCKAVNYDVEGEIFFNQLFFYHTPNVNKDDFIGSDGSPLLFPAIYQNKNGKITFISQKFKIVYAKETILRDTILCCVISRNKNAYVAISSDGFFVNFKSADEEIEPMCFVNVFVTGVNGNGYGEAEFESLSKENFDTGKSYSNYLKGMNNYFYDQEETINTFTSSAIDEDVEEKINENGIITISENYVRTLANIILMMSRYEPELRSRYGYLAIGNILSHLIRDKSDMQLYAIRMKYTKLLYDFSINNRLIDANVEQFVDSSAGNTDIREVQEMINVMKILNRYNKPFKKNNIDEMLMNFLTTDSTLIEKELSRLIISNNILYNFKNKAIEDQILNEIGNTLNINIVNREPAHIGLEEGQTVEFKTSIVYPPGDGSEDVETQSQNIARVISSMMNADGGTLYIGVNDNGNLVGLSDDLAYFTKGETVGERKARDIFKNYFSTFLTKEYKAEIASKISYDFEEMEGYTIFKVIIPSLPGAGGDYIRVGSTCQRK